MHRDSFRPASAFTHPAWLAALVVLVVNDHFLKHSGLAPAWLTGKLSDVAGLVVAPAVLAWVMRVRTLRGWIAAHVAVGAGFAALEHPSIAGLVSSSGVVRTWADPTDLLALPTLLLSLVALGPRPSHRPPAPARAIGVLALIACAATGAPAPAPRYPYPPRGILRTDVYVRHHGQDDLALSVQRVRDEVELDCDALASDTPPALGDGHFMEPQHWVLETGDAVPLWNQGVSLDRARDRDCYAVRVSARGRWWLVRWRASELEVRDVPIRSSAEDPGAIGFPAGAASPRAPEHVRITAL